MLKILSLYYIFLFLLGKTKDPTTITIIVGTSHGKPILAKGINSRFIPGIIDNIPKINEVYVPSLIVLILFIKLFKRVVTIKVIDTGYNTLSIGTDKLIILSTPKVAIAKLIKAMIRALILYGNFHLKPFGKILHQL